MKLRKMTTTWGEMVREAKVKNILLAVLVVTNCISVTGWFQKEETIVLVPAGLDERASVSPSKASESYVRAWALHVAQLVGNISPGNADFVIGSLEDILAPDAYRTVKDTLAQQIADIKSDSLTVSFEPRKVVYEPSTRKAFVYGLFQSRGSIGDPIKVMRTYEMNVDVRFGQPWVTRFAPYTGEPKTEGYWKSAKPEEIKEAEQAQKTAQALSE